MTTLSTPVRNADSGANRGASFGAENTDSNPGAQPNDKHEPLLL